MEWVVFKQSYFSIVSRHFQKHFGICTLLYFVIVMDNGVTAMEKWSGCFLKESKNESHQCVRMDGWSGCFLSEF